MEEPGYRLARRVFEGAGCRLVPGSCRFKWPDRTLRGNKAKPQSARRPHVLHPSLSINTPLGATMSAETKNAAPELGANRGIMGIIEDDYDSEYRFESAPISSLQGP